VLLYGTPEPTEGSFEELAEGKSFGAIRVRGLGRNVRAAGDVVAFWQILRLLRHLQPDIVHTHTSKAGLLGRSAAIAFNLTRSVNSRCAIVHTFHGHVLSGYFGPIVTAAIRWTERFLARGTDRLIAISDGQAEDLAGTFAIAPRSKFAVIPLGLKLDSLLDLPLTRERSGGPFVVAYVGRLAPIKDVGTLVDAFALLMRERACAELWIVGDGECRSDLERKVDALGLRESVRFTGWRHNLADLYSSIDAAVLSSRNEGTPVSLIEAMAAGRPVVATGVGGVPDVVTDGVTGLLVPSGAPDQLAVALRRVVDDPDLCGRIGAQAREAVRRRYSSERLVTDMWHLYTDILDRRRGRC
jgi:glycosyltransferase involved in cell wall biosynthesis